MTYAAASDRYDTIGYRRTGQSGLKLPTFSLGLWQNFGERTPYERQREIILRAFDLGITHLDIANRYGPPFRAAEKTVGRLLTSDLKPYRDELVIATKAGNPIGPSPYFSGGSRKSMLSSLDHSLRDLGVDYVDVFYHHRPDPETPLDETIGALVSAVTQGKALYVGISNYDRPGSRAAAELLRDAGVPLLIHQARYSLFDRHLETDGLFAQAADDGVGVINWSPLAQGLLTDKYLGGTAPEGARATFSTFLSPDAITDDYLRRARGLDAIAKRRGQSLAQLALQWVLRRPELTSVLIGASSTAQLEHNLAATGFAPFDAAELAEIDSFSARDEILV